MWVWLFTGPVTQGTTHCIIRITEQELAPLRTELERLETRILEQVSLRCEVVWE